MMQLARWVVAVPAGLGAAVSTFFLLSFVFSIAHGFDAVAAFWAAPDMNGMPIAGTYIIFGTRAITAAVLVAVIAKIVPAHHRHVAVASGCVVGVLSFVLFAYVTRTVVAMDMSLTMGMWYRNILELVSLLAGSAIGAAMGSDPDKTRTTD